MTTEQIYFYSTPSDYEDQIALGRKPMLKIGYTTQETTDERIKQQDTTACAQLLEKKGSYFTTFGDKEFHKHLQSLGYKKTRNEREWFYITVEDAERELIDYRDGVVKVEKYFKPRPHQAYVNQQILSRFEDHKGFGSFIQPLNLCARFGKDLQKLSLFKDSGFEVMVSAGYWLGANESTINTINERFDITSDIKVIGPDYQQFVDSIGKGRVMIDLSLHTDTDKIDPRLISTLSEYTKLIYIDEADFGAWTPSSRKTVNLFVESGVNLVCLATGTNIDRAMIGTRGHVVSPITVSYLDLIEAKRGEGYLFQPGGFCDTDREVWMSRLSDIVEVACVSLDAGKNLVDELNQLTDEKRPNMAKIFHRRNDHIQRQIIKNLLFNEDSGDDIFGLYSTEFTSIEHPAVMMFIPGTKADINNLVKLGRSLVPHYNWIALHGDDYNNRVAEEKVKEIIKSGSGERTVIVSCSMGSRSFSVPNIVAVINCKDGGSVGTAVQQASRCFTPGCDKEVGLVVNYSFNSGKTSTFETDLISSAIQHDPTDTEAGIRRVYGLINFYNKDQEGYLIKLSQSEFLEYITSTENLENMATAQIDLKGLINHVDLLSILEGVSSHSSTNREWKGVIDKARTYVEREPNCKGEEDLEKKAIRDLVKKIYSIVQTSANTYYMAPNSSTFKDCLETISNDTNKTEEYTKLVGVGPQVVLNDIYQFLPEPFMNMIILKTEEFDSYDNFNFSSSDHATNLFDL